MRTHLGLQFSSHSILVIGLNDDVEVIQILDDETLFLIHCE